VTTPASVVLVHGAWHRAACWDKVVAELAACGVATHAVELPFEGFDTDVATARAAIVAAGDSALVVGHSYGGVVVTAAASGLPNVAHLVYLCAFMLDADEDIAVLTGRHPLPVFEHLRVVDGGTVVDPVAAVDLFYADCAPADAAIAIGQLRALPSSPVETRARPAWRDVPSTYVVCSDDATLPPALQREMARHATHVVEWPTSHSPFLSQPKRVSALLTGLLRR
jgi:pimeloyl-ACP methyl ester carboxylesterase